MTVSSRQKLGLVVLLASPVAALILHGCVVPLLSLEESPTHSFPGGSVTFAHWKMHWPMIAVKSRRAGRQYG